MFDLLKRKIADKKKEAEELREYERKLRKESLERQKELQKQAKKKALEQKYAKMEERYKKTPAERRKKTLKKFSSSNVWDKLGKWSDNSVSMLNTGSVKKTQPKKKTNSIMDDFLNGKL